MLFQIKKVKGKPVYFIDKKEVTKEVFEKETAKQNKGRSYAEGISKQRTRARHAKRGYPYASDAMSVPTHMIEKVKAIDEKKGVRTEYNSIGQPIMRNAAHRRDYLKAHGYHDRNSYNGY